MRESLPFTVANCGLPHCVGQPAGANFDGNVQQCRHRTPNTRLAHPIAKHFGDVGGQISDQEEGSHNVRKTVQPNDKDDFVGQDGPEGIFRGCFLVRPPTHLYGKYP